MAIDRALNNFKFSEAYDTLYHFVWDDFADWYIEASKVEPNPGVLNHILESTLKLAHPFAPFITETIWQSFDLTQDKNLNKKNLLATELWPEIIKADKAKARQFEELMIVISESRQIAANVGAHKPTLFYENATIIDESSELVKRLGRLGEVRKARVGGEQGLRLTQTHLSCWLDIDRATAKKHLDKLGKDREEKLALIKNLENRLSNKAYLRNAPKTVVDQTREQLASEKQLLTSLEEELSQFQKATDNLA